MTDGKPAEAVPEVATGDQQALSQTEHQYFG
jgi:hypothetical protein